MIADLRPNAKRGSTIRRSIAITSAGPPGALRCDGRRRRSVGLAALGDQILPSNRVDGRQTHSERRSAIAIGGDRLINMSERDDLRKLIGDLAIVRGRVVLS